MYIDKFAREYLQKVCPKSQARAFYYFDNPTKTAELYLNVLRLDDPREQVTRKIILPSNVELPPGLDLKQTCRDILAEAGHKITNTDEGLNDE